MGSVEKSTNMAVHPLKPLYRIEIETAREVVLEQHPKQVVVFREIYVQEPAKADLLPFLELEHAGQLTVSTPRPPRLAKCQYVLSIDEVCP
jgi:primary-amine oxidase